MTVASWEKLPQAAVDEAAGRRWWVCRCGRPLYEHSRRKPPSTPAPEYTCARTPSERFESETLRVAYDPNEGLRPRNVHDPEPVLT